MVVEDSKGECNFGQHEINFLYADALRRADQHVIYKNAAKEMAAQDGKAITFMAKFNEREGNSCHLHLSLRGTDGSIVFDEEEGLFNRFLAGMLAGLRELTLFLAPNINSYKRYAALSFAPTTVAWGHDNRTCALRVVGHGAGRRIECRVPGADVNPYLAISALIAAGLHGVDAGLELEPAFEGNAYEATGRPQVPSTLRDARDLFAVEHDRARRVRPGGRGRTTSTTRASNSTPTTRRSPTGSASGASSVCRRRVVLAAQILQQGARRPAVTACISSRARRTVSSKFSCSGSPIPATRPTRPRPAVDAIGTTGRSGL